MKKIYFLMFFIFAATRATAQCHEIYDSRIATLQVVADDRWMSLPVIRLNSGDVINIGFDEFTHQYTRFTYRIEHCEADWSVSEGLFPSDFIEGFQDDLTIDDNEESFNTNILYTHYSLSIPNSRCRLKMSGNYKLTVFDENDGDKPVLTACFMIVEPLMNISMGMTANTDIDINNSHQQVSMQIGYGSLRVTNPREQIKTVVMQNRRWDTRKVNSQPQYFMPNGLKWEHCRDLIFKAGNEYRKYEILDVTHTTMGLEYMVWDGENYHAVPFVDEPRPNYVYDEDANGAFFIRNSDNYEIERTCEYVYVDYQLKCPCIRNASVYVGGYFTNGQLLPEYEMTYNDERGMYECSILQKQGYYNYQYLVVDDKGNISNLPYDGNYYQTENSYQALVYYRGQGERTDRLVAVGEISEK